MGSVVILHRYLALGIGTQIRNHTLLANCRQLLEQKMGKIQGKRHEIGGLVAGVTKHHSLVASTLSLGLGTVNTAAYVATLLMKRREHAAGVAVKLVLALGVANLVNNITRHFHQVDIGLAGYLARDYHLTGCNQGLASHAAVGVVGKKMVEQCVADLVSHFVGMSFRH